MRENEFAPIISFHSFLSNGKNLKLVSHGAIDLGLSGSETKAAIAWQ